MESLFCHHIEQAGTCSERASQLPDMTQFCINTAKVFPIKASRVLHVGTEAAVS